MTPTKADAILYGPLVADVYELRAAGHDVARFKGDYRVGKDVLTAAELRAKAAELRNRRQARKPDAPRSPMARHEIERVPGAGDLRAGVAGTAEINDRPGSPSAEHRPTADVRDKFWRAVGPSSTKLQGLLPNAGDGGEPAATRCRPSPTTPAIDLCGCGRSFAHGGRCWFRRGWPGPDKGPTAIKRASEPARAARNGNIAALWAEVDALKSTVERMRKQLAMELGR